MLGFLVAFLGVIAASFVFRRRFASLGHRGWARYCVATGVVTPILIVLGSSIPDWVGVIFAVAGIVAFGWVSAIAARLRAELSNP
jgi:purine-cytosine permease-like protein